MVKKIAVIVIKNKREIIKAKSRRVDKRQT
jgi:hypothetical protein